MTATTGRADAFRAARDFLLEHRADYTTAYEGFGWPRPEHFNWALDWFDAIARDNDRTALHIVEEDGGSVEVSFAAMSERSDRVANWLRDRGVRAEDRVLVMLGNQVELWETALAAMKLRAVVIPATPLLGPADLADRVERGRVRHIVVRAEDTAKFDEVPGDYTRIAVGGSRPGWQSYEETAAADPVFEPDGPTHADDPLMLYFTSGTTAQPKLVEHTHVSYPIGHLATMYWIGLRRGTSI
jgi:Acyl-coenzyme A synthetases/AMP-(fatty) acid ligases